MENSFKNTVFHDTISNIIYWNGIPTASYIDGKYHCKNGYAASHIWKKLYGKNWILVDCGDNTAGAWWTIDKMFGF